MRTEELIPLGELCTLYQVEMSFFTNLDEIGLIEITTIQSAPFIHHENISNLEKMIRIHNELDVNMEGIDVVFNLLEKIDSLQNELMAAKNRLRLYENE